MLSYKRYPAAIALLLAALVLLAVPAAAAKSSHSSIKLYLRRATFDPLGTEFPTSPAGQAKPSGRLVLVQFEAEPTAATRAALQAAGARPLLYIPDNALLVRLDRAESRALQALPGLRWYGPFQPAFKLPPELDALVASPDASQLDLRLLAAADADLAQLTRGLAELGGAVLGRRAGLNGVSLRVRLPAAALQQALRRDDVLWIERAITPHVLNDRARNILGITAARQQLSWLTGAGQSVAVIDTGLDAEADVLANANADFPANRIAAAFTPAQLSSSCATNPRAASWSDRHGHGTHVAGTLLGSGLRSPGGQSFAGVAPAARLIVQAGSTGGDELDCLVFDDTFLAQAYGAGARVQNASWGGPTGGTANNPEYGGYTQFASDVDDYLWTHKDHLLVVAAGNRVRAADTNPADGVIDRDSIDQPATAKNVLTVGASENDRPPTAPGCAFSLSVPENLCWLKYGFGSAPIANDFVSDNINGMAAFSARGPADDGRIKPEIVAPGTNIVSARSHDPQALAHTDLIVYNSDYAYSSGTSMSTPMLSGMAVLVRQWLAQARQITAPSAALVKALLLNGATNPGAGQYGAGATREIPADWPNSVAGWGRANLPATLGLNGSQEVWLADNMAGLAAAGATSSYSLLVGAGQPLRLSLAWTDFPGSPQAARALVNDLDLEIQTPNGALVRGNATAQVSPDCRDAASGADRCNNVESAEIAAPVAGVYTVRVRASKLPHPAQPFALVGRAQLIAEQGMAAPELQPIADAAGPAIELNWNAIPGATFYLAEQSATSAFTTLAKTYSAIDTKATIVEDLGSYWFRVRACTLGSCSAPSDPRSASVRRPPNKDFVPLAGR